MSLPFGVTALGFVAKDLDTIRAEMRELFRGALGNVNVEAGPLHQLIELYSNRERTLWELAESVYASADPDEASGAALDAVGAITDANREAATKSRVTLALSLDAATTVAAGSIASVNGNRAARFVTLEDVTSTTAGDYNVEADSEATGPVTGAAGTIDVIETPVAGWTAVTNAADAIPGTDLEKDPEYRARREDEVAAQGTGPIDAVRADLLDVDGVRSVTVVENNTDYAVDGLPPHSFEATVYDGSSGGTTVDDDTIAQTIWASKPAGIETFGNDTGTAIDRLGAERTVFFSRPVVRPVYFDAIVDVSSSRGWNAATGPAAIEDAVATFGTSTFAVGQDVILARFYSAIFSVPGVVDVDLEIGFSASPSGTANLAIAPRELATFDTSRVTVTATPVVPS